MNKHLWKFFRPLSNRVLTPMESMCLSRNCWLYKRYFSKRDWKYNRMGCLWSFRYATKWCDKKNRNLC